MSIYLTLIVISALIDVAANLLLKKSNGFESKIYGFGAIALVIVAFILLSLALKYVELSIAYSTWGAIGILGTCLGGYIIYKEKISFIGLIGVILVIFAAILLNF